MEPEGLTAQARQGVVDLLRGERWDWWVRLECRGMDDVSALTALDRFRDALRAASNGVVVATGLHRDPMLHAHAALKLSRRLRADLINAAEVRDFLRLRWSRGSVWLEPFDQGRAPAALAYLARHPETVSW